MSERLLMWIQVLIECKKSQPSFAKAGVFNKEAGEFLFVQEEDEEEEEGTTNLLDKALLLDQSKQGGKCVQNQVSDVNFHLINITFWMCKPANQKIYFSIFWLVFKQSLKLISLAFSAFRSFPFRVHN